MPISNKNKLIFVHIPKNAGTSITESDNIGFELHGHHTSKFYKDNYPKQWEEYNKFAIIRDPWDRVVSNYEYSKMSESYWHSKNVNRKYGVHPDYETLKDVTFKDMLLNFKEDSNFLKHQGWGSQYKYICDLNDSIMVDNVFNIDELGSELFKTLIPNLKTINKSNKIHNNYKEYYDDETKEIVNKIYEKDIEIFKFQY